MDLWKPFRLSFDLAGSPPDAHAIARVRLRASPERLQRLLAAGACAALAAGLLPAGLEPQAAGAWVLAQGLGLALAVALPVLYWVRIADLLATATQPLGPAEARAFAAWAERDAAVGRYWAQLVALRRAAVYGDYAALVAHAAAVAGRAPRSNSELQGMRPASSAHADLNAG